jgi:DNA-binding NtrC family response regulator
MRNEFTHHYPNVPVDLPNEEVLFGTTPAMQEVRRTIDGACREGLAIVIHGEDGTGKTTIANYAHQRWCEPGASLVKANCAAISLSVLEKDLLGSGAGSKTAAAAGGTLFLYETGEVDVAFQSALVAILRRRWIARARDAGKRSGDVRIVYATGVDGGMLMERIPGDGVAWAHLPALRERKQDIPRMCEFLMRKQAQKFGKGEQLLTEATVQVLKEWRWPGNVRELENWIARVVILGSQDELTAELRRQSGFGGKSGKESRKKQPLAATPGNSAAAQATILQAMQANGWSRRKAAEELKISYRALTYSLRGANVPRRRKSHREIPPMQ